jgi:dTDP-4-dehydrorhamnose reductase
VFDDVWFSPLRMETLALAAARVAQAPVAGVFNLGAQGQITKSDFARGLALELGLDTGLLSPVPLGTRTDLVPRPRGMGMNSALFESTYGMRLPTVDQELQGLAQEYRDV